MFLDGLHSIAVHDEFSVLMEPVNRNRRRVSVFSQHRDDTFGGTGAEVFKAYIVLVNQYYVSLEDLGSRSAEGVIAVLAEYGHPATITIYRLHEYGKLIMDGNAVETIQKHFS